MTFVGYFKYLSLVIYSLFSRYKEQAMNAAEGGENLNVQIYMNMNYAANYPLCAHAAQLLQ